MKFIHVITIAASLSLFSCGSGSDSSDDKESKGSSSVLFNNEIDSVVYYTHEVQDMLENEMVLEENDPALEESLFNYDFYIDKFQSLSYYYNAKKVYSDKKDIAKLTGYFNIVSFDEPDQETFSSIIFRDVLLFYKDGNIIAAVKLCFSCNLAAFNCYDKAYADGLLEDEMKVLVNTKGLEEFVTGVHRQ